MSLGTGLGPMFRHHSDMNTSPGHIRRYAHCKRRPTVTHRNQGPHVQRTRTKIRTSFNTPGQTSVLPIIARLKHRWRILRTVQKPNQHFDPYLRWDWR